MTKGREAGSGDVGPHRRPRIAVTGSAGVGKTTLGRRLAETVGVPFVAEGMRERVEGGLDLHALGREGLRAMLLELLEEMEARARHAVARSGGFVADRCAVDVAAFWLYYGYGTDGAATERLFSRVRDRLDPLDLVVVLPWGAIPLAADGVRSANPWLQLHYQTVLEGLLRRWLPEARVALLPTTVTELERRLDLVLSLWERTQRVG